MGWWGVEGTGEVGGWVLRGREVLEGVRLVWLDLELIMGVEMMGLLVVWLWEVFWFLELDMGVRFSMDDNL